MVTQISCWNQHNYQSLKPFAMGQHALHLASIYPRLFFKRHRSTELCVQCKFTLKHTIVSIALYINILHPSITNILTVNHNRATDYKKWGWTNQLSRMYCVATVQVCNAHKHMLYNRLHCQWTFFFHRITFDSMQHLLSAITFAFTRSNPMFCMHHTRHHTCTLENSHC